MAGLCEGGNEPPGSLKANKITYWQFENESGFLAECFSTFRIESETVESDMPILTGLEAPGMSAGIMSIEPSFVVNDLVNDEFNLLIPDLPRKSSVAAFRLATGHDCLAKHLHRIGIYQSPNCPLCNSNQEMDSEHLKICASVANHDNVFEKYWSARGQMTLLSNAWH
ncbi:hypothetical protein ANN_10303 [Periplaneta americana]|uniref:Uncharacterized protein n=1 Tax=Periplaneta americana TaxID=6978 RepID=A0ABQ8TP15_PERAM|nr:hypothetical protein ANN_10303 [Periplaneta americana]